MQELQQPRHKLKQPNVLPNSQLLSVPEVCDLYTYFVIFYLSFFFKH